MKTDFEAELIKTIHIHYTAVGATQRDHLEARIQRLSAENNELRLALVKARDCFSRSGTSYISDVGAALSIIDTVLDGEQK